MIKAIFFDVDGTLVSFKTHSTLPSTKEAISRLKENGIKCFVATGRSFKAIKEMPVKDIHFDGYLTLTGQLGLSDNGEIIYEIPFDEKMTRAIIDVFYEKKIPLMITEKERVYHNFIDDRVMETFTLLNARDNIAPVDDYHGDHIYQAMTYIRPYSDDTFYNTEAIRNVVNSGWFMTILWVNNIAIYVTNLFYFAGIIDSKRDMLVKISFGIFSILSTVLINVQIVNLVAGLFGII